MQCFHRETVIKGNMTENTDKFSLCQAKRSRAEVLFKEVGSSSFVSVGLLPPSAAPEPMSTYFLYDFSIG